MCRESTTTTSGEGAGETVASADELAQLEAWARSADPVLARFGRAGLAMAGVDEEVDIQIEPDIQPVAVEPVPVVALIEPEIPPAAALTCNELTNDNNFKNRTTPPAVAPEASPSSCSAP